MSHRHWHGGGLADLPQLERAPLTPAWQALLDLIPTRERRLGVTRFIRFCSRRGTEPAAVSGKVLDAYETWLWEQTLTHGITAHVRVVASNWTWLTTHVPDWPTQPLFRRDMRETYRRSLADFPPSLRAEAEGYLQTLATGRLSQGRVGLYTKKASEPSKGPRKALAPRTVTTRRDQLEYALTALVETGTPIESILTLHDLVQPIERVTEVLQWHANRRAERLRRGGEQVTGDITSMHLVGITEMLRQIAKYHCRLPKADVEEIAELKISVTPEGRGSMTAKNMLRLRGLLEPDPFAVMILLPPELMREARKLMEREREMRMSGEDNPGRRAILRSQAARLAMHAALLEIAIFCPLRRENLFTLRLGIELQSSTAGGPIRTLYVAKTKVRGKSITWPIEAESAALLKEYITDFRPILAEPSNPYLAPGEGMKARDSAQLATDLKQRVESWVGREFNMHLVRHFAVARFLMTNPGQYQRAADILGHKDAETTRTVYAGLELEATARLVNAGVLDDRKINAMRARIAFDKRAPGRRP